MQTPYPALITPRMPKNHVDSYPSNEIEKIVDQMVTHFHKETMLLSRQQREFAAKLFREKLKHAEGE